MNGHWDAHEQGQADHPVAFGEKEPILQKPES